MHLLAAWAALLLTIASSARLPLSRADADVSTASARRVVSPTHVELGTGCQHSVVCAAVVRELLLPRLKPAEELPYTRGPDVLPVVVDIGSQACGVAQPALQPSAGGIVLCSIGSSAAPNDLQQHIVAADEGSIAAAVGRFVRELRSTADGRRSVIPADLHLAISPAAPVRGFQLSLDGSWNLESATAFVKEQATMGMNTVDTSRADVINASTRLGLKIQSMVPPCPWQANTSAPEPRCLERMAAGWGAMPHLDHLSILGGDDGPNVLPPAEQLGTVKAFSRAVRKHHPDCAVWVSLQEYSQANLTTFAQLLQSDPSVHSWLSGLVYGPHVRFPMARFLKEVGPSLSVLQYPDLCHPIKAQYPIQHWHWPYAFVYGRSSINPLPRQQAAIVRLRQQQSAAAAPQRSILGFGACEYIDPLLGSHYRNATS